jgi:peptidyl-prolyl cis-trans isomerase B (cyclophilin B)
MLVGGTGAGYLTRRQERAHDRGAAAASPTPAGARCFWRPIEVNLAQARQVGEPPERGLPDTGAQTMTITTNLGVITVRLDTAHAPCTSASFAYLGARGFFAHSSCHHLLRGPFWTLQCGDPTGTGLGGPGYRFADEDLAKLPHGYPRGTVAMANFGAGTNGSQFFFVVQDSPLLPKYTPFGTVTGGMGILDKVAAGGDDGAYANSGGGGHPKVAISIGSLSVR